MKVVINSLYGYLGYRFGSFNDYDAAAEVTEVGRGLLRQMASLIEERGGKNVELDTDGALFVPPEDVENEEHELAFVAGLSESMPEGINVDHDGRWRVGFFYKIKNYALLDHNGRLTIKGGALKSRSLAPFVRSFIDEGLRKLLDGDVSGLRELYLKTLDDIEEHRLSVDQFARRETLHDRLDEYRRKVAAGGNRRAAYELALRARDDSDLPDFHRGDQIRYYVRAGQGRSEPAFKRARFESEWEPDNPDEDTRGLLAALKKAAGRFGQAFEPGDHRRVFAPPSSTETPIVGITTTSRCIRELAHGDRTWVELASKVKLARMQPGRHRVNRGTFVSAEDEGETVAFLEQNDSTDVYTSAYTYVLNRKPTKRDLVACPKIGDYFAEVEAGHEFSEDMLDQTRQAALVYAQALTARFAIPADSIRFLYNGNCSIYLKVPREVVDLGGGHQLDHAVQHPQARAKNRNNQRLGFSELVAGGERHGCGDGFRVNG